MASETTPQPTSSEIVQKTENNVDNNNNNKTDDNNKSVSLDNNGEHLLQSSWTFWFARKIPKTHPSPVNYAEHLQKIASFNTVESFYKTYVYLARPQELPKESIFHMFKGDAIPMWESFPNGGCWVIKINKKQPQLALIWEELLVYCIGETFEEPDIVGVVLSVRAKEYILQIWNSDCQNNALRVRVCDKLKYYLRLDPSTPIEYKANSQSLKSNDKAPHRNGKVVVPPKDKKKKKKGGNKSAAANANANNNTNNANNTNTTSNNTNASATTAVPPSTSTPSEPVSSA